MGDSAFKKLQPEEYFRQHYEQGQRPDGRKGLATLRPVSISVGSISSADGSAIVKQGDTLVVCGIKLEIAEPKAEAPKNGFIVPNLILSPVCHSQFKSGPPSETAQVGSHFINEVIANSGLVDPEDLCISEGKYVWCLYIDLSCLNYAGNILDTSIKALTAALKSVKVPKVNLVKNNEGEIEGLEVDTNIKEALRLGPLPLSCTIGIFEDKLLLDPTDEEETLAGSNVTIVLTADDNELCHVHKPGGVSVSPEQLQHCISLAKKQCKSIKKLVLAAAQVDLRQ